MCQLHIQWLCLRFTYSCGAAAPAPASSEIFLPGDHPTSAPTRQICPAAPAAARSRAPVATVAQRRKPPQPPASEVGPKCSRRERPPPRRRLARPARSLSSAVVRAPRPATARAGLHALILVAPAGLRQRPLTTALIKRLRPPAPAKVMRLTAAPTARSSTRRPLRPARAMHLTTRRPLRAQGRRDGIGRRHVLEGD